MRVREVEKYRGHQNCLARRDVGFMVFSTAPGLDMILTEIKVETNFGNFHLLLKYVGFEQQLPVLVEDERRNSAVSLLA